MTIDPIYSKPSISLEAANRAIQAGLEKAAQLGLAVTVAVTDEAGNLKALQRMEGASILSVQVATDKAFTAATSGFDTGDFADFIAGDPPLLASLPTFPRMALFAGGLQIRDGAGSTAGAVGVSGGHYSEDLQIAQAAVQAVTA
jgi:uncharacterized protein GlcG (DUF336 family)